MASGRNSSSKIAFKESILSTDMSRLMKFAWLSCWAIKKITKNEHDDLDDDLEWMLTTTREAQKGLQKGLTSIRKPGYRSVRVHSAYLGEIDVLNT